MRSKEEQEKKRKELGLTTSLRPSEADVAGEVGTTFPPTENTSGGKDTNNSETGKGNFASGTKSAVAEGKTSPIRRGDTSFNRKDDTSRLTHPLSQVAST